MIHVLIASKKTLSAGLLADAINARPQFNLVALCESDEEILRAIERERIEIALIHARAADSVGDAIQVLKRIRQNAPHARIILLCEERDRELVVTAFRSGARGIFSLRDASLEVLCKCVERVQAGQVWANSKELEWVLRALENSHSKVTPIRVPNTGAKSLLSQREKQVVRLALDGLPNREIAETLKLSEHTIKNYLFRIYEKLGISTRTELLLYFMTPKDDQTQGIRAS